MPNEAPRHLHWFDVKTDHTSTPTLGYDAMDAVARRLAFLNKPIYCRLHDEMPADRRSGQPGEMGFYTPLQSRAISVQAMSEGYAGGGMCVTAHGPVIDLTGEF